MTFRLVLSALFGVALGAAATPACAEQTLFETVKDWKVLKKTDDSGKWQCLLSRVYKDEDDESVSSIVIVPDGDKDAIALGYGNWDYGKEHKRIIVFLMGGRIIDLRSSWSAEGTQLGSSIPASLRPALLNAGELTLRFKDGDATFKVPGLPEAYEAVTRCNTPPPVPPQPRIAAYMMGLLFEKVLAQCDVATTGRQRSQLEAKLAALRPEMAGIEAEARRELAANPPAQLCPPADKTATFARKLDLYTSLTPEAFAAEMDREEAEKQAKAVADQKAAEQAAAAKAAEEKAAAERKAADEKALAERNAAKAKAADDKAAAERKAAEEKAAADGKAAEAKAADDKAAADRKAADDKATAEKAAAEKPTAAPGADSPPAETPSPRP